MGRRTWNLRIDLSSTDDAVYADAVLVDGPAFLTGHGRACVEPGCQGQEQGQEQSYALAARRSLTDLVQAMRATLETRELVPVDRS